MLKFWLLIPILLITGCSPEIADTREVRTGGAEWELVKNSVYDGDTFRVIHSLTGEKLKIRMACIDAPEKKQPLGIASRDYLRSLLNQNPNKIILSSSGKDRYERTVAEIFLPDPKNPGNEIPVNGMMIKQGMAYFYADYASACKDNSTMYAQFEKDAQRSRLGVWASKNSIKPWDYRRAKKNKE